MNRATLKAEMKRYPSPDRSANVHVCPTCTEGPTLPGRSNLLPRRLATLQAEVQRPDDGDDA